jgi:hypothetical protein
MQDAVNKNFDKKCRTITAVLHLCLFLIIPKISIASKRQGVACILRVIGIDI